MNAKKLIGLLLAVIMLLALVTGCGKQPVVTENQDPEQQVQGDKEDKNEDLKDEDVAENVKTGLSVVVSASGSADATEEKNGSAKSEITLVAVTVGDDGVIDKCVIDMVQAKIEFDAAGALITDSSTVFSSKNELGAAYGMAKASSIGKEWYEQAASLAEYVCGKTLDELNGIALNEKGVCPKCGYKKQ